MSRTKIKDPNSQRNAEVSIPKVQVNFLGMMKSTPNSEISQDRSARNINIVDYGKWAEARPGSRRYSTSLPTGNINARIDHTKKEVLIFHIGTKVYISDKAMTTFTEVINISSTAIPDSIAMLAVYDDEARLATSSGIFRIVLTESYYYMYRINTAVPNNLITDIAETSNLVYGYNYLYSVSRISGSGVRDRITDGVILQYESGTCLSDVSERDYGQCFFDSEIGEDLTADHVIGIMQVPSGVQHVTHFSLYRTKNIGENSNGIDPISGKGNNAARFTWVADIPIAKSLNVTIDNAGVATAIMGEFDRGDVGCTFRAYNGSTGTITAYSSPTSVTTTLVAAAGTYYISIGGGRAGRCVVNSNQITLMGMYGGVFSPQDVGRTVFFADGTTAVITAYGTGSSVDITATADKPLQAFTIQPGTGNFFRNYNDYLPDEDNSVIPLSLQARISSGAGGDLYVPRRFWRPVPSSDLVGIDSGFSIYCSRGGSRFYYCQIGDKEFCDGYYRPVSQEEPVDGQIRHIVIFPSTAVIFLVNKTYTLPLNNSTDDGREDIGEVVFRLNPIIKSDDSIGIYHWQSIAYINSSLIIALTNEPAIRTFDGHSWSRENFAIDQESGDKAVSDDIEAVDPTYGVASGYSRLDGYLLWLYKWVDAESLDDSYVIDHGGTSWVGDDVWQDNGGTAIPAGDIIQDNGGTL
jgi:hypothetical protein